MFKSLNLLCIIFIIMGGGVAYGQYIEHLCPECEELFIEEDYEGVKVAINQSYSTANNKEDSLLLDLNLSIALGHLSEQEDSKAVYTLILEGNYEKYTKAYCLALEQHARQYMFTDKNKYLSLNVLIDSIATADDFIQGKIRSMANIGHAFYTLKRDLNAAYFYFMDVLSYDEVPKSYYMSVVNGAYDCSYKLGKSNTDSLYTLAMIFIQERIDNNVSTNDSSSIRSFYGNVGNNLLRRGELDGALEHNLKAVEFSPKAQKYQYGLCRLYFNISRIFHNLTNYEKAHEYADKIQVIADRYKYKSVHGDLAVLRGNLFTKQYELEKAKDHFNAFFEYNRNSRLKQNSLLVTAYADMAYIYMEQDSLTKADRFLRLGKEMIDKTKEGASHMNMHSALANYYLKLKDYNSSLDEASLLHSMSQRFNDVKFENVALEYLSKANYGLRNYKVAFDIGQQSKVLQDSIFRTEQNNLVFNLEAKHFKKEQALEIDRLKTQDELSQERLSSQKQTILIGGIALLLISLLSLFLYRQRQRIKDQKDVINNSLIEKELLLKEIHHRVKNNLQVVSSLLSLQSEYIRDESALTAINDGRSRVQSMALIHQNLYSDKDLIGINMKDYMEKLIQGLFDTYNINDEYINLHLDIEELKLDVDTVVPLGLIANELVSNALKHAFTEQEKGEINIQLKEKEGGILSFSIKDNGKGMDTSIIQDEMESFGYQMIIAFKDKLEADLYIDGTEGLSVILDIKQYTKH